MNPSKNLATDTKQVFRECGTCSQTFSHLLNREFGHPKDAEERALDLLAGGIMNHGHQCGMLWGSALAVGAEAFRRHQIPEEAIAVAVTATQQVMASFLNRTNTINCREITGYNLNSIFGMTMFMLKITLTGMNNSKCFNLAEAWAPEAIQSGKEGLAEKPIRLTQQPVSCASEVVKRMGASNKESVMVAGFAGGLGLCGGACGALSAAIWKTTLDWCKENPGKNPPYFNNPDANKILKTIEQETSGEMLCKNITGQSFESIEDHSKYINEGGCEKLIEVLGQF